MTKPKYIQGPGRPVSWTNYGLKFECHCGRVLLATDEGQMVRCPTCEHIWLARVAIFDVTPDLSGKASVQQISEGVEDFLRDNTEDELRSADHRRRHS